MSAPTVSTAISGLPAAANSKLAQSPGMVDSAKSVKTPQNFLAGVADNIVINTIEPKDITPMDEKEQRLLDYVSHMDELRKTTGAEGIRIQQAIRVKDTVKTLTSVGEKIEEHINLGENELFWKADEAFFMIAYDAEVAQLKARQGGELRALKTLQEQLLIDRSSRKVAKRFQRELLRRSKFKDSIIHDQESAHKTEKEVEVILSCHLRRIDQLIAHTEAKQKTKILQLANSQDRKIADQGTLMALHCKGLNLDDKTDQMKEFQFKINHQKNLNKKIIDHLREGQELELRHLKTRLALETTMMEEISNLRADLLVVRQQSERSQHLEYVSEKDRISDVCEASKILKVQVDDNTEVTKLLSSHRHQVRQIKRLQRHRTLKRLRMWALVTGQTMESRGEAIVESDAAAVEAKNAEGEGTANFDIDTTTQSLSAEEEKIKVMRSQLQALASSHKTTADRLFVQHQQAIEKKEEKFKQEIMDLEAQQDIDTKHVIQVQQQELAESNAVYLRELEIEAQVRGLETAALHERKVLNSLLDNVIDGVISINPLGQIMRFNAAAERMFKISASTAIGKNIKSLMPQEHAANHDQYIHNYLATGIRKVIGRGRQFQGLRTDGTTFPILVTVSEVAGNGLHLFTAIVQDMTEEMAIGSVKLAKGVKWQSKVEATKEEYTKEQQKSAQLLRSMMPSEIVERVMQGEIVKPEQFPSATLFFSDIVGFSDIAAAAHDIVNLLNDLYVFFDSVIANHDAYKVETNGPAYMVVSGIPSKNGDRHATEIADMSLALLSGIYSTFRVRHEQGLRLHLRIGIHTGPCTAGFVGAKAPRYTLFGDTVDAASKMQTAGSSMRIQLSDTTYKILNNAGGYRFEKHGEMSVKVCELGVSKQSQNKTITTYWLLGKDGFSDPLPSPEDWPVAIQK